MTDSYTHPPLPPTMSSHAPPPTRPGPLPPSPHAPAELVYALVRVQPWPQ